jgi:hypothetical protein
MAPLLTNSIPIVETLCDHGDVPVIHTGNAVYSIDGKGGRWIRKREINTGIEEMLAEILGWMMARQLDVPVPGAAVFLGEGERSWLSSEIRNVVHWEPSRASLITNYDGFGAMMALDALIMNTDRHAGNILLQPQPDELHLYAWAIDHGQALVGWPVDFSQQRKAVPSPRNLAKGIPVDLLVDGAMTAAEKATRLSSREIHPMVTEACTFVAERQVETITEVLAERCAGARGLVEQYLKQVRGR